MLHTRKQINLVLSNYSRIIQNTHEHSRNINPETFSKCWRMNRLLMRLGFLWNSSSIQLAWGWADNDYIFIFWVKSFKVLSAGLKLVVEYFPQCGIAKLCKGDEHFSHHWIHLTDKVCRETHQLDNSASRILRNPQSGPLLNKRSECS